MNLQKTSLSCFRLQRLSLIWLSLWIFICGNSVHASNTQPIEKSSIAIALETGAIAFLEEELKDWQQSQEVKEYRSAISLKVPSSVKQLASCEQPINFQLLNPSGALWGLVSVQASCPLQDWQLNLRLKVSMDAYIPVLKESLSRDDVIQANQIDWQWVNLGVGESEFIAKQSVLIGLQVERRVRRGEPILRGQVRAADLIMLGEQVIIEARSNSFVARMLGQALDSGSLGKPIRVKNLSSGKTIIAYPIAPGIVTTTYP